ncbi:hypothetical protein FA15DRAFT_122784 [Coprinopsis marcescibilis]|uniref:DUF6533 domain-containing protein n=1 Tax=Coprinopsis marcescibilis TaxID=230819 RepID=A0A5C3KK54_COPMA|nr:hypothetical protein FA15DRAFT_122784 [Coprinopsis marcescibilis]
MSTTGVVDVPHQDLINLVRYNVYVPMACLVVLFAEYLDTLELEVSLIWPTGWTHVKVLYFTNRFLPLAVIPFVIAYNITTEATNDRCKLFFTISCMGILGCTLVSEAILYIRVLALSGMSRPILIFIIVNGTAVVVSTFALLARYVTITSWGPKSAFVPGCVGQQRHGILVTMAYAITLYSGLGRSFIYDPYSSTVERQRINATVVAILCVYFGVKLYWRDHPGPIIKIFYRDGTLYFIALALLSIGNGVSALVMPAQYRYIMTPLQAVVHSSLSIRMILHLRENAREDMGLSTVRRM